MGQLIRLYRGPYASPEAVLAPHEKACVVNVPGPLATCSGVSPQPLLEDRSDGSRVAFVFVAAVNDGGRWRKGRGDDFGRGTGPMASDTFAFGDSRVQAAAGRVYCAWPVHDYFDRAGDRGLW